MAGFNLRDSLAEWTRRARYRKRKHTRHQRRLTNARARDLHPRQYLVDLRDKWSGHLREARAKVALRKRQIRNKAPLRERAYREAAKHVGTMEQGGNNRGPDVEKLIHEGGGLPGQAWCGWFLAACYKRAGSKAVTWHWGAVRLYVPLSGISRTSNPRRGDPVRFTFDHIGMFVRDLGNGQIETIEGNTGATGAVSDSKTGGDGVYRKTRSKSLVRDYLRVTR